jgi:hypothetical protein
MYLSGAALLLGGVMILFNRDGVLRRPFGFVAGVAGYTLAALLAHVTADAD